MENDYTRTFNAQKAFFDSGKTRPYEFRRNQLKLLDEAIREWEGRIIDALRADLGKSEGEALTTEIGICLQELKETRRQLKSWMKPTSHGSPLALFPSRSYIHPQPKGVVLIISPWNYPFNLSIVPLISAIAAGNTVVLKPSEDAPATAQLLEELLTSIFPPELVKVVQGIGSQVVPPLIEGHAFNHVFFTGSTAVGREIAKMAAVHLSPVTLELGGKSPAIVDATAHLKTAGKRIAWGKFTNAGQTCISPDYLLVKEEIKQALIEEIKEAVAEFYGENPKESGHYARMVNAKRFEAVRAYLQNENVVYGGDTDASDLYISPTIIDGADLDSAVMKNEIFGPVLPILTFRDKDHLVEIVSHNPYPLALYYFGKDKSMKKWVTEHLQFGGGCINNTLVHTGDAGLPFGGIQYSGQGHYHGKFGFDTFSHFKSMVHTQTMPDLALKYPPYTKSKLKWIRKVLG